MAKSGKTLKIRFYGNERKTYEKRLIESMAAGLLHHGIVMEQAEPNAPFKHDDVVLSMGVKNFDRLLQARAANIPVIYFDKSHDRTKDAMRVAFNSNQPTEGIEAFKRDGDRAIKYGWHPAPWKLGESIIIAGSTAKYHHINGLLEPTGWAKGVLLKLRKYTNRPVWYRPKPTWKDAVPIEGAEYSRHHSIKDLFPETYCLITYGSNACFDALRAGIPSIVLGNGVTRMISSRCWSDVENLKLPSEKEVQQFMNRLAYYQWDHDEFANGAFWEFAKCELRL
jgi:hypothetical protein